MLALENLSLLALICLMGCGNLHDKFGRSSSGTSTVNFQFANGPTATVLNGVMIYAVRQDDASRRAARYLPTSLSQTQWALPNGVYQFLTVGYTIGNPISGSEYCGASANIPLAGGAVTVPITMAATGICGSPPFAPLGLAGNVNQPYNLKIGICHSSNGDISLIAPPSTYCDSASGRPANVSAGSVRISLPEFDGLGEGPPVVNPAIQVTTGCLNGSFIGAAPGAITVPLPLGAAFLVKVEAWISGGCIGTSAGTTQLNGGVINANFIGRNTYIGPSGPFSPALQMGSLMQNGSDALLFLRQIL